MEKSRIRPVIWVLLTALSFYCYIYLHTESVEKLGTCPSSFSTVQEERTEDSQKESKILLPDIAFIKKVLNVTKIVMPKG